MRWLFPLDLAHPREESPNGLLGCIRGESVKVPLDVDELARKASVLACSVVRPNGQIERLSDREECGEPEPPSARRLGQERRDRA